MRIRSLRTSGVGPLPDLEWEPGDCEVIFDDNQQGKTTLIDLLIDTVFREGRKKLFDDARRYEEYGNARVVLSTEGNDVVFGEDGDDENLSDLLGWRLPELHRLLCIRASEVNLAGPVEGDNLWESLASVLEGMSDNYIDSVRDKILDQGNLTPSLQWQNQQPDYFKDSLYEDVVPGIDRAREGESVLREALEYKKELADLEEREEQLRNDELDELEETLDRKRRQRELMELLEARDRLEEARQIKNEIDEDYGRILPKYEDPWREALDELEESRQKLDRKKETLEEYQSERDQLKDRRESINEELDEINESIRTKQSELDRRSEDRDEKLRELRNRRSKLDQLTRRAETARDQFEQWGSVWDVARWVLIAGFILLTGSFVLTPIRFLYGVVIGAVGLLATAGGTSIFWVKQYYGSEFQSIEQTLEDALREWSFESEGPPLEAARELLKRDVESLLSGEADPAELREEIQSLKEDRSGREGTLNGIEDRLGTLVGNETDRGKIQEVQAEIETVEETLETLEATCEDFRQKTGLPDFETYQERLEERRDKEGRLQSLTSQLIGRLDVKDDATLSDLRAYVDRREEALGDVNRPDESSEELERTIEELEKEIESVEFEVSELKDRIRTLRERLNETVKPLHDLGVDLDAPEELFDRETEWERTLNEAVLDRLAAAYCVKLLEEQKGDYMESLRDLLNQDREGERNLSQMYADVMDPGSQVELDPVSGEFSVVRDGFTLHETGLSSGARTHLYFSCRLVLLKELFVDEPGFMILDDPFLTYFPDRKEKAIGLLEPYVESGWQILFFTVDPTARDVFRENLGAGVSAIGDLA